MSFAEKTSACQCFLTNFFLGNTDGVPFGEQMSGFRSSNNYPEPIAEEGTHFEFRKPSQPFIGAHDEALSVAVRVNNPDAATFRRHLPRVLFAFAPAPNRRLKFEKRRQHFVGTRALASTPFY